SSSNRSRAYASVDTDGLLRHYTRRDPDSGWYYFPKWNVGIDIRRLGLLGVTKGRVLQLADEIAAAAPSLGAANYDGPTANGLLMAEVMREEAGRLSGPRYGSGSGIVSTLVSIDTASAGSIGDPMGTGGRYLDPDRLERELTNFRAFLTPAQL